VYVYTERDRVLSFVCGCIQRERQSSCLVCGCIAKGGGNSVDNRVCVHRKSETQLMIVCVCA